MKKSDIERKDTYRKLRPGPGLTDIVEKIWIQHEHMAPRVRKPSGVLPTGTVELLFHYGDRIAHIESGRLLRMPRSYVTGQRSRPVSVVSTGRHRVIIVSLYPWGLNTLYPEAVCAIDGYVDLRLLDSSTRVEKLEEHLRHAGSVNRRVQLVEEFLMSARRREVNREMVAASRILAGKGLKRGVHHTKGVLNLSERHLSRQFKSVIGLPPSVYMRIMRFQHAISARRESVASWAAIAADCGYSDQSHLVREIRRFSGRAPENLKLDSRPGKATFNGSQVSEFFDTVYV